MIFNYLFSSCPQSWNVASFQEVVDFQEGPGILAKDFTHQGVPLLRLKSIERPFTSFEGCNYLDPEMVERRWSHFRLKENDILLSTSGTLGRVSLVKAEQSGSICYTGIIRMRPKNASVTREFIRYFLQSPAFLTQANASGTGSVLTHFGPTHLRKMAIPVPPVSEQHVICDLLSGIDDKIELNRQTARTLEELAQRLFKSWFVDFDPVRTKMDGRQPGHMPPETAALFPDKLVDSPLGPIPEGWRFQPLIDVADFVNGRNFTKDATGKGRMVIRIAELNSGPGSRTVWNDVEADEKYIADSGDILFAWSGSLGVYRWYRNAALINQHIFKVIPRDGLSEVFCFQAVNHLIEEFQQIATSKAVTMGHIKRSDLKENGLHVPVDPDLIKAYSDIAQPLWERALLLEQESETLAELRDCLLPKLISGEIRVPEARCRVEAVDG